MNTSGNQPNNVQSFNQFEDMSAFLSSPAQMSAAFVEFIGAFFFNILRLACVPAEVIFRRKFGERHFNLYLYFGGTIWLAIFATGWLNIPALLGFRSEGFISNGITFTIIAIIYYGRMFMYFFVQKHGKIDDKKYTYYPGHPLSLLSKFPRATDKNGNPREYLIRQFYEPAFMLALGILCAIIINPQTGSWLIISAFCMAIKEYAQARHTRNMLLNQIDADLIGRFMGSALEGKSPESTQGIYIAGISNDGEDRAYLRSLAARNQQRFTAEAGTVQTGNTSPEATQATH
ncbi:MAG: hypothetical protein JKY42_00165 [Flavobacteriales bacterium]|nr:hypothetical protein [Flavobacteriales bacterium]